MQIHQNQANRDPKNLQVKTLADCIRADWGNLTDEEISYADNARELFYLAVGEKYSLTRDEIERQVNKWERECMDAE